MKAIKTLEASALTHRKRCSKGPHKHNNTPLLLFLSTLKRESARPSSQGTLSVSMQFGKVGDEARRGLLNGTKRYSDIVQT